MALDVEEIKSRKIVIDPEREIRLERDPSRHSNPAIFRLAVGKTIIGFEGFEISRKNYAQAGRHDVAWYLAPSKRAKNADEQLKEFQPIVQEVMEFYGWLGSLKHTGTVKVSFVPELADVLKFQAGNGDLWAQIEIDRWRGKSESEGPIEKERLHRLQKAGELGFADIQINLGLMYESGHSVPQDHAEAARWFRKAADQGHPAGFRLGHLYAQGLGVPLDNVEAYFWYCLAAKIFPSRENIHLRNNASLKITEEQLQNVQIRITQWKPVPSQPSFPPRPPALETLRNAILERNLLKEISELKARIEQSDAEAFWMLGNRFSTGDGVLQDYAAAMAHYRRAIELGCRFAFKAIGRMYEHGLGVNQDWAEALNWYRQAAEHGDEMAPYTLSEMFEHGYGVQPDAVEAYFWRAIKDTSRARKPDEKAEELGKHLTDDQKRAVARRIDEWKSKYKV